MKTTKQECEYIRYQAKRKFDKFRGTWCDLLRWALPYRATWILSQTPGERKNQHIVDPTHTLALRSAVAGFLEGNTSTTRPWYRIATRDSERNENAENKAWLQHFTDRTLSYLASSNFYEAVGEFYYDYHVVNTGAQYFEELPEGGFHVHTFVPGSYFVINDSRGVANILVREFALNVKSIVDTYAKDQLGKIDWTNVSSNVKKMYEDKNYSTMVDLVHLMKENPEFDPANPNQPFKKKWLEITYEAGAGTGHASNESQPFIEDGENIKFLKRHTRSRKPFVVGKSTKTSEYGEKGATLDALGLIKSLNKKAISKDQALEQIVHPALQGPATLRKSYISSAPNTFVPLDARSMSAGQKLESINNINPAIGALIQDVGEMRQMVDKIYYADFLLYLTNNPKTRTATETNAIVGEQQRIIGPSLQSLNFTYNVPVIEFVMEYVLEEDPFLREPPEGLRGQSLKPQFVSIFAQAQKAADLPAVDRYIAMMGQVAQMDPSVLDKVNLDELADIYEDRLYLPAGLNRPQTEVDEGRAQAQRQAQEQQRMTETIPAMAKAAKDASAAQSLQR